MADKTAPGAVQMDMTPDYEAMVVGAHPDDADFATAATSALWARQGKKVIWVVMTDGTEGSDIPSISDQELMLTREQEQRLAAEVLGVEKVEFLRFPDGHLVNNDTTRRAVTRLIRKYRPRVLFTHDPTAHLFAPDPDEQPETTGHLNHPDHRATGNIALDAIFPYAGNPRSYRELLTEGLQPYRPHEVYLFSSTQHNTYIDVTETIDLKGQGLSFHATQFSLEDREKMPERLRERAAVIAREGNEKKGTQMQYAEAFRRIKLHVPPSPEAEEPEAEA